MHKFIVALLSIILIALLFLSACGSGSSSGSGGNSNNRSEYLPESVLQKFEEETGIKVNFTTLLSNEEMYAKLSAREISDMTSRFQLSFH